MGPENVMDEELAALVGLHCGLERQGPGDPEFSRQILAGLPTQREFWRIADFGCGSGAGALLIAEWYGVPVKAVDLCRPFLDQLAVRAHDRGLAHLIHIIEADMGNLDWAEASLDLIWSEGAAYNLTFPGALKTWRPLLATGGVAVISELSWFTASPAPAARDFWAMAYPAMADEETNRGHARAAGFEVLATERLPARAWWAHYYGPLQDRITAISPVNESVMMRIVRETGLEMDLFRRFCNDYGYTFYILRAQ